MRQQLQNAKKTIDSQTYFVTEDDRILNIIKKLAQGHAKFENSETQFEQPYRIWFKPITLMSDDEIDDFFSDEELSFIPEIGSRGFQRMRLDEHGIPTVNWIIVQENIYYYSVVHISGLRVRMFIWKYIAAEVIWE